jgi:23S rRNA (cytosine1962-C5)-methyltransferase
MKILIPTTIDDYKLLDSGNGLRLEQFGQNIILRPDSTCLWQVHKKADLWNSVSAEFRKTQNGWGWYKHPSFKEPWTFNYKIPISKFNKQSVRGSLEQGREIEPHELKINLQLRLSQSKNIGIFPEQASNWEWMTQIIKSIDYKPNILNLFAYTGAATLCAAATGAQVCHVDASQAAINWAKTNQKLNNMENAPIRWIVDDCSKFVIREIKRGMRYDGLILDPPAFGRDPKGKIFEFEKEVIKLLDLCKQVLKAKPLFVIFNGYSMGHSATILKNLLQDIYPKNSIEFGELHLQEIEKSRTLPCSIFARFCGM